MNQRHLLTVTALVTMLASTTLYMGCKIDSADSVIRNVRINVAGLYQGETGEANNRVMSQHTGAAITQLNVVQDGDRLQAVDNNGLIFRGTIGNATGGSGVGATDSSASFTLEGQTTAGAEGIISGTISVADDVATMRGTWAEPSLFGNVLATASVEPTPEQPGGTNAPASSFTTEASCEAAGHTWNATNSPPCF